MDTVVPFFPAEPEDRAPWRAPLLSRESVLHRIADELALSFSGIFAPETVERYVCESYHLLTERARITTHVVGMTKRFAGDRLRALGQANGLIAKAAPEVLFVCVHNAGRSQMAAALLRRRGDGRVHVMSAGSAPTSSIHPAVVAVMAETGIDLSGEFPKPLTDEVVRAADVVITMGCGDACAVYPGKRYLDWALADPSGEPMVAARAIRDEIDRRVSVLLGELLPAEPVHA